jgi:hypothetical protein
MQRCNIVCPLQISGLYLNKGISYHNIQFPSANLDIPVILISLSLLEGISYPIIKFASTLLAFKY